MIKSIMSSDEKKFQFLILPPGIPKNVFRIITYQHQKDPTSLFFRFRKRNKNYHYVTRKKDEVKLSPIGNSEKTPTLPPT